MVIVCGMSTGVYIQGRDLKLEVAGGEGGFATGKLARWAGLPGRACCSLEPFPPQILTSQLSSCELRTLAEDQRALVWGNVPCSAFCSRSRSRGTKTSAETLEFFNLKPKVRSFSLSLSCIHSWQIAHSLPLPR